MAQSNSKKSTSTPLPDPAAAVTQWLEQMAQPNKVWESLLQKAQPGLEAMPAALGEMGVAIEPEVMARLQSDYIEQLSALWQGTLSSTLPPLPDKRFAAPVWHTNPLSAFQASSYLLNARFLTALADAVQAPAKAKQKLRFSVQQMIDAMSPANFLATNPEAQQKILDTKGESLVRGMSNMLSDMKKGHISQTDENAFEVGTNVATSEGAVVFENAFFQLLQYKPLTKTVAQRPLLIVPPCINKFYILDLQPANSLVRYAVDEGHTVFLVSWRNADESIDHATWDEYIEEAVIKAIDLVQTISNQPQINALGFCVGGTLLSTALAVLAARGEHPVASLTLLTTFLDFSDTGAIDVYVDEERVAQRELAIGKGGLMQGKDFAAAFSSLRPNDLIWNYVGANYLKGEEPVPFDLLYWNADSTNMPGPMFCWYLRNTYLENNLKVPGKLTVCGEALDFGLIDTPAFIYASREDHIVPWESAYASMAILNPGQGQKNRFVLGASGHIAGVVNPPAKKKRNFWSQLATPARGKKKAVISDAADWLKTANDQPGSWWPEWSAFLAEHAGKQVAAPRSYGNKTYPAIEPAPGRYVKQKAE